MKCENCQTLNPSDASACSQCGALLNDALHKELALVNDLIRTLSKRDKGKTSVSRLLSQNLKRRDHILAELMDQAGAITHPVKGPGEDSVATSDLGAISDVQVPSGPDFSSEITVRMDMLAEEAAAQEAEGSVTRTPPPEPREDTGKLTPPPELMPRTRVMNVELTQFSDDEDVDLGGASGAEATVRFSNDSQGLLTDEEMEQLSRNARDILESAEDTVAVSPGLLRSSDAVSDLPPVRSGTEALLRDIRAGGPSKAAVQKAKAAPRATASPATLDLKFRAGGLLYPLLVVSALFLSKAILGYSFADAVNPATDASPLTGFGLLAIGVGLLGAAAAGRNRWSAPMVDTLRLCGVLFMPAAFLALALHQIIAASLTGAAATGLVAGGLLGLTSVQGSGRDWTGAAATLAFALSCALIFFLMPDLENFYSRFTGTTGVVAVLAGVSAALSFMYPRLGRSAGLGISGAMLWLTCALLGVWVVLKDWQIDVDAGIILPSLALLIIGYVSAAVAARSCEPLYGAAILLLILAMALLRKAGVPYPQTTGYLAILATSYLYLGYVLLRGGWAEYCVPFFVVGGYVSVAVALSLPALGRVGPTGAVDWLLPIVLPATFCIFLFLRRRQAA